MFKSKALLVSSLFVVAANSYAMDRQDRSRARDLSNKIQVRRIVRAINNGYITSSEDAEWLSYQANICCNQKMACHLASIAARLKRREERKKTALLNVSSSVAAQVPAQIEPDSVAAQVPAQIEPDNARQN